MGLAAPSVLNGAARSFCTTLFLCGFPVTEALEFLSVQVGGGSRAGVDAGDCASLDTGMIRFRKALPLIVRRLPRPCRGSVPTKAPRG